jgi:outer membrane lipoprotein-sorting protein
MKKVKTISIVLVLSICSGMSDAASQDAGSILKKMDDIVFSPRDKQGKVTMILTDKTGKEKIREAELLQKGPDKKLYRYTKPESQAGIATLTLPGNIMWLYLPAFGKPKKISMLTKDQSFNNTDFSWEDMATTPYAERFTPELLESTEDSFLLSLVPLTAKSNYSKIIVRVNKKYGYAETMEYYDLKGKKFKEQSYRYNKVGEYWNAEEVIMNDLEKKHSTKILISGVKFDQGISDDIFLVEKMKPAESKKQTNNTKQ